MIVSTLALLTAVTWQTARFGPFDNIVVNAEPNGTSISAFGDAHVVKLHAGNAELAECVARIRTTDSAHCTFAHSGSLTVEPLTNAQYKFTFADVIDVNIVDFIVDSSGLAHALTAMTTPQ